MSITKWFRDWLMKDVVNILSFSYERIIWLEKGLEKMTEGFDLLHQKLQDLDTVEQKVLALITDLNARIQSAITLEEAQQIAAEIDVEKQKLVDALPPV